MKKNTTFVFVGLLALALTFGLTGCPEEKSDPVKTAGTLTSENTVANIAAINTALGNASATAGTLTSEDTVANITVVNAALGNTSATAGTLTSEDTVANITVINAALGDASVTPKTLVVKVDGTNKTVTFDANYTLADAFGDWDAFKAFVDGALGTATIAGSNGAKLVITSKTSGTSSEVELVTDEASLFGTTPVEVAGAAATPKTLVVKVDGTNKTVTFDGNYTSTDAFGDWAAFKTFVDGALGTATITGSNGAKLVITSKTSGTSSEVELVTDEASLFGTTPVEVAGAAATPKTLVVKVDGTNQTVTFNKNYTVSANAFADWAAFKTFVDTALGTATITGSDGAKLVITSKTTGTSSKVELVTDEASLFGTTPVEVAGTNG
ncbi:hypothetical protein FACS1894164_20970 [Spirochaetia bacterium]|nr:hypothetical protein FACS1894164_20970 [Spirochaetia bacterium]